MVDNFSNANQTNRNESKEASAAAFTEGELVAWLVGFSIVDILIVVSNIITIAVFTQSKLLRRRTNFFLLTLAVADMMVGTISLPLFLHTLVVWVNGGLKGLNKWVSTVHRTCDIFTGFASVFALTIISLERLYSVALPNWHRTTPNIVYFLLIALIWTLASVLGTFKILEDDSLEIFPEIALFYVMIVTFFVCLVVICVAYMCIWIKVKLRKHEKTKKAIEKDKKLAMTLLFVTAIFIVTWLPFQGMNIIIPLCGDKCRKQTSKLLYNSIYFTKLMQYTNSFINPVIYTFKIPAFKRALLTLFGAKSYRAFTKGASRTTNGRRRRLSTLRSSESAEPIRECAV